MHIRHFLRIGFSLLLLILKLDGASAQWIGPAFDTGCYYPTIGAKGEIETLEAQEEDQLLGGVIRNLGRGEDGKERILIYSLNNNKNGMTVVTVDPPLDLSRLDGKRLPFQFRDAWTPWNIVFVGPIHHSKSRDILVDAPWGGRIYWDLGDFTYDSSVYTVLRSHRETWRETGYGNVERYITFLTQDSVVDLVIGTANRNPFDSCFLDLFKGGKRLFGAGHLAYSDTSIYLWPLVVTSTQGISRMVLKGDFRGTGREDLIAANDFGELFFFKNDPPFSLRALAHSLEFDTLLTNWQNAEVGYPSYFGHGFWLREWAIAMQALPKNKGDKSQDFLTPVEILGERKQDQKLRIFRGGPDFGKDRLFIYNPDAILRAAHYYDDRYWGFPRSLLTDVGNMNGSGNKTLFAPSGHNFLGMDDFYVMGDHLDDQIDLHVTLYDDHRGGLGRVDTLDANGDGLTDVLIPRGRTLYSNELMLYYGSRNIRRRGNLEVEIPTQAGTISVYRDLGNLKLINTAEKSYTVQAFDVLGRSIANERVLLPNSQCDMDISDRQGVIIVNIASDSDRQIFKFLIRN